MNSVVCTLFEGDYHLGLAALANSLYVNGYRGKIFAGYKGALPLWCMNSDEQSNRREYKVADDCEIVFIQLETTTHFAYFKPIFMLQLLQELQGNCDALFYFDPDIVVRCRWSFFEEWIACGITSCEDLRSPLYYDRPQKTAWRQFYEPHGFRFEQSNQPYVNSGFLGVTSKDIDFLENWKKVIDLMRGAIGEANTILVGDPAYAFAIPDQDALNIAIYTTERRTSFLNKQAMGFEAGGFIMCHAIGRLKPWRRNMLLRALRGEIPMVLEADKEFVKHSQHPIQVYSPLELLMKKVDRWLSTLICKVRT